MHSCHAIFVDFPTVITKGLEKPMKKNNRMQIIKVHIRILEKHKHQNGNPHSASFMHGCFLKYQCRIFHNPIVSPIHLLWMDESFSSTIASDENFSDLQETDFEFTMSLDLNGFPV